MARNKSSKAVIEHRRAIVARLRLRGQTAREIVASLAKPIPDPVTRVERPVSINPRTGRPWGLGTIGRDLVALEKQWRTAASEDIGIRKARLLAETDEAKREAWKAGDLRTLAIFHKQEREMCGLDNEVGGSEDKPLTIRITGNIKPEDLCR